jgi:molecular chaperone Hsp33
VTEDGKLTDQIARGLFQGRRVRVVVVTATAAVREMAARNKAVGAPAVALGRAALAGLLLATLTKDEEQVTLQVMGKGPIGSITVDARSSGNVRGFVKRPNAVPWDPALATQPRLGLGEIVGKEGVLSVIRDLGMKQNYSGQVAMSSGEIDDEVEHYLTTSEQIDSVLHCDALVNGDGEITAAAGLLIQTLPQAHGAAVVEFLRDTLRGPAFSSLLATRAAHGTIDAEAIAREALGPSADDLQILDVRDVKFFCPCTPERAESMLGMLRPDDLKEMILETNDAEVTCNFCGQQYHFSEIELERIRRKHDKPQPQS